MIEIALLMAVVCLYSTGHWIGATLLLFLLAYLVWVEIDDPTGFKRYVEALRRGRQ